MTSISDLVFHAPFVARVREGGLDVDLSMPWYRSLPISCLSGLEVKVDGRAVPADAITLTIGGVTRTVAECVDAWQEFWFVQDPATVHVDGVVPDGAVRIAVHLLQRIPYLMVGPDAALPHHTIQEERFEVTR